VPIEAFVPYDKGDLLNDIHKVGMVEKMVSILFD
jgi:GTPase